MYRILLIHPDSGGFGEGAGDRDQAALLEILTVHGFSVSAAPLGGLNDGMETLCHAFGGRPPHLLLADLTAPGSVAAGTLPLRHIQRIQRETWGEECDLLPMLALLTPVHLSQRDWPAFVDDFLVVEQGLTSLPDELVARIRLVMFRRQRVESNVTVIYDLRLDFSTCRALDAGGRFLALTPREFDLLRFLLTHRGKLFSRERLLELVWGIDYQGGVRTVDIHIRRLRAKLPPRAAACLETRRGIGYGFVTYTPTGSG